MAEVVFQHVGKAYSEGARAVDDLTLDVSDGEFVVIVGPSGSGKTTALRMVAGLEEISEGTISIGGRVVNHVPARDRNIAMVFQSYALYPHMTVHDNLAFGLQNSDAPRREIERRIDEAVMTLDLGEYLRRKPRHLSGGQRQRVALGRAIVRDPTVFLMDEPLSNLDAQLRVRTRTEIHRLQRRLAVTTIYVTHDQVEAMTMADRVAVMRRGRLQQFAPPEELYARPWNAFVGGFMGSPAMNFLEGTIQRTNGDVSVLLGGERLALGASALRRRPQLAGYEGKAVIVGIRPEAIQDAALVPDALPERRLHGTVVVREALGPELFVHFTAPQVRLADGAAIADLPPAGDATLVGRFSTHSRVREGDVLEAVIDTDELHFFDPSTGASIDGAGGAGAEQRTPPGTTSGSAGARSNRTAAEADDGAGSDVAQLAGVLRGAERARRQYLAELNQGDAESPEDWSTWYAEYLLGMR